MHNFFLHKNILIFRRFFNSANRFKNNNFSGIIEISDYRILSHFGSWIFKTLKSLIPDKKLDKIG